MVPLHKSILTVALGGHLCILNGNDYQKAFRTHDLCNDKLFLNCGWLTLRSHVWTNRRSAACSLTKLHFYSHSLWDHVHPQFIHHISNCHWGSLVLPSYTVLCQPTMDISVGKSNIRELIRLKTMGHKSANDRITRRRVLFGAGQTQHTTRKMQNANQL